MLDVTHSAQVLGSLTYPPRPPLFPRLDLAGYSDGEHWWKSTDLFRTGGRMDPGALGSEFQLPAICLRSFADTSQ